MAVLLILMSNINLFLFYGTDGILHFERLFLGIDTSLPLAFFNVLYFLFLFAWVLFAQAQAVKMPVLKHAAKAPRAPFDHSVGASREVGTESEQLIKLRYQHTTFCDIYHRLGRALLISARVF
jgi:hypothetical protein